MTDSVLAKNLTPFTLYNFLIIPSSHPEVREEIILTPKLTHVAQKKFDGKTVNIIFMYHFQEAKVDSGPNVTLGQSNK